jgi:hypothetical protein
MTVITNAGHPVLRHPMLVTARCLTHSHGFMQASSSLRACVTMQAHLGLGYNRDPNPRLVPVWCRRARYATFNGMCGHVRALFPRSSVQPTVLCWLPQLLGIRKTS